MKKMTNPKKSSEVKDPKVFKGYPVQNQKISRLSAIHFSNFVVPWEMNHTVCKA